MRTGSGSTAPNDGNTGQSENGILFYCGKPCERRWRNQLQSQSIQEQSNAMLLNRLLIKPLFSRTTPHSSSGNHSQSQRNQSSSPTFRVNESPNPYQLRWTLKQWEKTAHDRFDHRGLATSRISKNILETLKDPEYLSNPSHYKIITAHSPSGKIRAACMLHIPPNQSTVNISQLVSPPRNKAKGAGKAALFGAHNYAKNKGCTQAILMPYNNRVSKFYRNLGYQPHPTKTGRLVLDLNA